MAPICCMSRDERSGSPVLSARPAIRPPHTLQRSPAKGFPSASSISMLEEDATTISNIFSEAHSEGDSSSPHCMGLKPKRSSATIKVVTDRLRKHISRESGLSNNNKRNSRSTVGTSEEEIERRAELKRIREKRILAELSAEDAYDDDARSLVIDSMNSKRRATWQTGDFMKLMEGTVFPDQPGAGEKCGMDAQDIDKIFDDEIFNDSSGPLPNPKSETDLAAIANLMDWSDPNIWAVDNPESSTPKPKLSRRHSSASFSSPASTEDDIPLHIRKQSALAAIPPSPVLEALRLPSITEPAMNSSWRLSYSVPNRAESLRRLSNTSLRSTSSPLPNWSSIPIPVGGFSRALSPAASDHHPGKPSSRGLNRWLHSQGLRSPSQALTFSEDTTFLSTNIEEEGDLRDFGGVDGSPREGGVLLSQMSISRRLAASRTPGFGSEGATPPMSPTLSLRGRLMSRVGSSSSDASGVSHFLNNLAKTTELHNSSAPKESIRVVRDAENEAEKVFHTSPSNSRFDLAALLTRSGGKGKPKATSPNDQKRSRIPLRPGSSLSPTRTVSPQRTIRGGSPTSLAIPIPVPNVSPQRTVRGDSPASLAIPILTHRHSRATMDSSFVSETESHRRIEAELLAVKTRFAGAEANRCPSTPRSSKFREEFADDEIEVEEKEREQEMTPPSSTRRRRSTRARERLTRIGRRFAGRSSVSENHDEDRRDRGPSSIGHDGTMDKSGKLGVPSTSSDERRSPSQSRKSISASQDDQVLGAWGQTVKATKAKGGRISPLGRRKSIWEPLDKGKGKEIAAEKEEEKEDNIMDDWEAEMERTAKRAKAKSRKLAAMQRIKLGPDLRYPETWSKFPSDSREERATTVGGETGIGERDFAVAEGMKTEDGETVWFQEERKYHEGHVPGDDHQVHRDEAKKGFFRKLEDKFKDSLPKFEGFEREIVFDDRHGRRGSANLGRDLEFPELEMLPISIMSAAEIEEYVAEQLKLDQEMKEREAARLAREKREEELRLKEEELEEMFGGRKKKKGVESAIARAKREAEEITAAGVCLPAQAPKQSKREKMEEMFGREKGKREAPSTTSSDVKRENAIAKARREAEEIAAMACLPAEEPKAGVKLAAKIIEEVAPVVNDEEEKLDTAGMNESVLEQQIKARMELKKKMEERRKAGGGRRGPIAKKRDVEPVAEQPAEETVLQPTPAVEATTKVTTDVERATGKISPGFRDLRCSFSSPSEPEQDAASSSAGKAIGVLDPGDPKYYADCLAARVFTPSPPPIGPETHGLTYQNLNLDFRFQNRDRCVSSGSGSMSGSAVSSWDGRKTVASNGKGDKEDEEEDVLAKRGGRWERVSTGGKFGSWGGKGRFGGVRGGESVRMVRSFADLEMGRGIGEIAAGQKPEGYECVKGGKEEEKKRGMAMEAARKAWGGSEG